MSRRLTIKVRDIAVRMAAAECGVEPAEILSRARSRRIAHARQYAMWLLRELGYSYPQIGLGLGVDHATVIHGVRSHEKRAEEVERPGGDIFHSHACLTVDKPLPTSEKHVKIAA